VQWKTNRNSQAACRILRTSPVTLSDHNVDFKISTFFKSKIVQHTCNSTLIGMATVRVRGSPGITDLIITRAVSAIAELLGIAAWKRTEHMEICTPVYYLAGWSLAAAAAAVQHPPRACRRCSLQGCRNTGLICNVLTWR